MAASDVVGFSLWDDVPAQNWNDWHWQLSNAIRTVDELNTLLSTFTTFRVTSCAVVEQIAREHFSFKITPYMLLALKRALDAGITGAWDAFRWSFIPTELESSRIEEESDGTDCIGEEMPSANPVPAITIFYKNRVLFRVTTMCPAYCRYCFRRRMVGDGLGAWDEGEVEKAIAYVASNRTVHEVILSGGDPLILSDERLAYVISALKAIPHVRRLRIDTRALTMMPQRVTDAFVNLLRRNQPFFVIGHFSHPYELTAETRAACTRLIDAGIPVKAHTPLLKGINDSEDSLVALMEMLVDCRVQPYYLIHFIPTKWTEHFRVSIARGLELIRYLHKSCGGLANPTYIVYLPEAGGKVPVAPQYIREVTPDGYLFESFDGRRILYREPAEAPVSK